MKKKLSIVLALVMILALSLAACGKGGSDVAPIENIDQYISGVEYKDMPYFIEEVEVTDEDVEAELEMLVQYESEQTSITEGVVEDGDTINVAFEGKIDGETFEGGSSESYDITIGETSMIDGFVEGLVGANIGDTVTLNLKFPDDYHSEEVAGKDVVFEVTIHNKVETTTPELNDEFAQNYYELETLDELREKVRGDLLKEREETARSVVKSNAWNIILKNTEVTEYPEEELQVAREEMEILKEDYKSQAEMYGMEWADFLTSMMGTDEAGFEEMLEEGAKENVKTKIIRDYIAAQENVTFSDSEFKDRLKEILDSNNLTEETFQSYYNQTIEEYAEAQGWRESFLLDKVLDKIIELGKEVTQEEYDTYIEEQLYSDEETEVVEGEATEGEATEESTEETTEEATEEGAEG